MKNHMDKHRIVLIAAWVSIGATALAADPPRERLNVRDFGASGSKFETTAETTAGSRQVMVTDTGDFKVGQGVMLSDPDRGVYRGPASSGSFDFSFCTERHRGSPPVSDSQGALRGKGRAVCHDLPDLGAPCLRAQDEP